MVSATEIKPLPKPVRRVALESPPGAVHLAGAKWMWPESYHWDLVNSYALFRYAFFLDEIPSKAPLFITADQSYQLYLNGAYIGRGPARGYQSHWPYDEREVAQYLKIGRNVLAIRAHNPGVSNFQYIAEGFAGMLCAARWGDTTILSGEGWRSRRQSGVASYTVPASVQLFRQEHIDLRIEDPRWMEADYDDTQWGEPIASMVCNSMPWPNLEERKIPLLEERWLDGPRLIGVSEGRSREEFATARDVALLRHEEGAAHEGCDLPGEEIAIPARGEGRYRSYLFDFGRTVVGGLTLEVEGAWGGEIIDTFHAERIDPATLAPYHRPGRASRMAFAHRMICRPGAQRHAFYHTFGFRYMVLTVRGGDAPLVIRTRVRSTMYPLERHSEFETSDLLLKRIWETCVWTQRICMLDAYVDTPCREQVQWWGDARVQAMNTFFYSGDARLLRRGISQIAAQTTPDGLTYGHAPTSAHSCILPDFTLIWMLTLWDYYWQTKSLEPFLAHQRTIHDALAYFRDATDSATGLVGFDSRYWLFLDWATLFRDGYSTVYNLWLLIAIEKIAELGRLAGMREMADDLDDWAGRLRKSLAFLTMENGLLADGITFGGKIERTASIHVQTLAIIAKFSPKFDSSRIQEVLLPYIRGEVEPPVVPSSYWMTNVFEVLIDAGFGQDVIEFIRRHWESMVEHGTTWECFLPVPGEESFSHAWSAHPLSHLMQTLGGIRQKAAGWSEITFQPCFWGDWARVAVPTPQGKISSGWERSEGGYDVHLELPRGITALVCLPGTPPVRITDSARWRVTGFADVPFIHMADKAARNGDSRGEEEGG